jgi:DNA-directed RNA polymerase specialized sigma subunit
MASPKWQKKKGCASMTGENDGVPRNPRGETGDEAFFTNDAARPSHEPLRTEKSVKEMLKQCLDAQRDAEFIEERIARLKSLKERMTTRLTGMPRGTLLFDQSAVTAEIDELEVELARRVILSTLKAGRLFRMMLDLPENQQLILRMRYIDGMSWKEIMDSLKYTKDYCLSLNRRAVFALRTVPVPEEEIIYLQGK